MKMISVPGINGLGMTKGVEKAFEGILFGDFEEIHINEQDISEQLRQIREKSKKYFDIEEKICFFGGDHSISFPLVNNFFLKFGKNSKLLIFDAHFDLMFPMKEPTHEEWLRAVIESGFNPNNILIVGIRKNSENIDEQEINYAHKKGIKIIYSDEFNSRQKEILEFVNFGKVYCSFDVDVFDSSIVSCTGYPEKQGLDELQVLNILEKIKDKINFYDFVEVNFEKGVLENVKKMKILIKKILKTFS